MKRIVTVVVALALIATGVLVASDRTGEDTYTLTADVTQAPNLFAGSRVMVRGVEVGEITAVTPSPEAVRVTMEIEDGVKIPAQATLAIVPITVISDRYVQFFPAYESGPAMADGDHIPLARTSIPAELDDVLTQVDGLLDALEPKAGEQGPLARLIAGLDEATRGRADDIRGTLEGSADVLANLAASDNDLRALVTNLDRVFSALADRSSEIGLVNERFALVAEALLADVANLEGTIEHLTLLSNEGSAVVRASGGSLGRSFGRLGRVIARILEHEDSLVKGMRWTNAIAEALGATDATGRGLYAYTGRQAAVGSARAGYNYRIDSRDTIACERIGALVESLVVLNPEATIEQLRNTLLGFVPDVYLDDLTFLLDLLLPLCADLPGEPTLDDRTRRLVEEAAQRIGPDRLAALLARWLIEGDPR